MAKHVAIKCTYNNGGEGVYVGFNGTCSENIIKRNIENGRIWCNRSDCKKYYNSGFKMKQPFEPCYESCLFRYWQFGAGVYHTGKRAGKPIHLSDIYKGKIVILTTRFPDDDEEINRRIIGFFKIGKITNTPNEETNLIADKEIKIRLPMDEARELFFWDYYKNKKGGAQWGAMLVRYLNDEQMARILTDLKETLRDEKAKVMVSDLLNQDFANVTPSPTSGPRIKRSGDRAKRIYVARKYGSGGEGPDHKKLKKWVAQNPNEIGLANVKRTEVEYIFTSGDIADVYFELEKNKYAVVEVETDNPDLTGCCQALKYKVMKCAELGVDIKSSIVEPILVAWSITQEAKDFCRKYGVRFVRKRM